jgi:hypothetical protein
VFPWALWWRLARLTDGRVGGADGGCAGTEELLAEVAKATGNPVYVPFKRLVIIDALVRACASTHTLAPPSTDHRHQKSHAF